ncbi:predicted NAD/FAD-binding protein [Jatrophihabitans sp. GAS493]|uniref:NAD(P)/FAD-dependent oxidoreductase n=1 Tax=Jatrophihabitans sp. GAS493 TaxID=1907575 RepID=UPI000BC09EDF|nr:FAD-dependent oxidoreductase [Jatrophihabitans sp. GAS493]SOD73959.1 predicted NAD/FAD-binding protein [Jatrophihabitans sp. GAS493]
MQRRRVAVVGGGVAGLTAAYVLQRDCDVTLYEGDARLGGHADTHDLLDPTGRSLSIDTGFIVHNERTYPLLRRLFRELGVATQESDMSMSISCGQCGLEYAGGRGVSGIFPSARTALRPRYLRMLTEVTRFHRGARAVLAAADDGLTLADFLAAEGFTGYFVSHFVTPLVSAVWSCAPSVAGQYPARYLFAFLDNHGMLSVSGSPNWQTVVGGSARYVERVAKGIGAVQTSTPVRSVRRRPDGVEIRDADDGVAHFDATVIATHPNQALTMLTDATALQRELLASIGYTRNPTQLHTDTSVLPSGRRAQASWNYYLPSCEAGAGAVNVSYNMNRLQRLHSDEQYVVTLNGAARVDPARVLATMEYEHPIFTTDSVAAQRRLPELNDSVLAFAGAYHGWGFHEDGCRSGVEAARSLGVEW